MKYNYETLKDLSKQLRGRVTDLLALAPKNDPFYTGTPSDVAKGAWFARVYGAAGFSRLRAPHLRRVHYWVVSQEPPILMPDGLPYENTEKCWEFIIEASKAARYLELVPLDGIVDNKNPRPTVNALYWDPTPRYEVHVPDLSSPDIDLYGLYDANVQPYHIEIWCEKSTMNDVLLPVCQRYNANLVTFEGEVSITSVCVNLMHRIRESGWKPTRIFYVSDFDPAGNSMPVAMSRKLEYALRQADEDYDVKVRPLALTADQVAAHKLPRIPIKETEKRAGKFEAAFGSGAVELDALEALYPGTLARIVETAIQPYYSQAARRAVNQRAYELREAVAAKVAEITSRYEKEIEALHTMQEELREIAIDAGEYAVERYEPHVSPAQEAGWLFDSGRDYLAQIAYYKAHKGQLELDEVAG